MLKLLSLSLSLLLGTISLQAQTSPNGKITMKQADDGFVVTYQKQPVVHLSKVGIETTNTGQGLRFEKMKRTAKVKADYHMLQGKRLHCTNRANEYVCTYRDTNGKPLRLVIRLYNDGIAFRYELEGLGGEQLLQEHTTYSIPEGTRRWFQQWSDGYEGFFPMTTTGEGRRHRWGYPALMEPQAGVFALIAEANIERRQSASSLVNDGEPSLYRVFNDENKALLSGEWHTPWRVVIIGSLADVVESTLITDVSEPTQMQDTDWIQPGVVSWIYWAHNHGSNDLRIIRQYIDMAATLHLPYMLIDAEWDEMKDGNCVADALAYAHKKGVKPMIWYNSSVGWVNGAPGPKFRLNKPEDREREFAWCHKLGVAGVKVDFFAGDTQANMDYQMDLLESAARHHLLINFHGSTIPRGWQRTYPHLLSTEGVYGAEWYNNVPTFTDRAARHNATLPFTRNVIGPMDYTPCAFSDSQHPHITSHAHELALTVLYESGLQHLADRPESFFAQPQAVQQFLSRLPAVWDETRLIAGYPGESAVIARRSGRTWYVAGINGTDSEQTLALSFDRLHLRSPRALAFYDSGRKDQPWDIREITALPRQLKLQPRGGFLLVIE